jgi:hypothetical protein
VPEPGHRGADAPAEASTTERLAQGTSRRGFLAKVSRLLFLATSGSVVAAAVKPGEADAYHFCGHTYTTGSCPHPTGIPRIDSRGRPLRARDGAAVDNLGRPIDPDGRPLDESGRLLRDLDGRPLPPAPRTAVCDEVARRFDMRTWVDGSWYRCCGGQVRKLMDCCAYSSRRVNGDAALTGYCFEGRKVFCVMYYQTRVPC